MNKLDFIEIGTSDFDTLSHHADASTTGIAIEPLPYYVDRLPKHPNIKRIAAAITPGAQPGTMPIYWVHPDDLVKHNLPDWLRGCNRIGGLHLQHMVPHISPHVRRTEIQCMSLDALIREHQVSEITFLKLDTEGMDSDILLDYAPCLQRTDNPAPMPDVIQFETNCLTHQSAINQVKDVYAKLGYKALRRGDDSLLIRKLNGRSEAGAR